MLLLNMKRLIKYKDTTVKRLLSETIGAGGVWIIDFLANRSFLGKMCTGDLLLLKVVSIQRN